MGKKKKFSLFELSRGESVFLCVAVVAVLIQGANGILQVVLNREDSAKKTKSSITIDGEYEEATIALEEPEVKDIYEPKATYAYDELSSYYLQEYQLGSNDYTLLLVRMEQSTWSGPRWYNHFDNQHIGSYYRNDSNYLPAAKDGLRCVKSEPFVETILSYKGLQPEYSFEDMSEAFYEVRGNYVFENGQTWAEMHPEEQINSGDNKLTGQIDDVAVLIK